MLQRDKKNKKKTEGDVWSQLADSDWHGTSGIIKEQLCSMPTVVLFTKKTMTASNGLIPPFLPSSFPACFVLPEAHTLVSLKTQNKKTYIYNNLIAASPLSFFFICYSWVLSQAPSVQVKRCFLLRRIPRILIMCIYNRAFQSVCVCERDIRNSRGSPLLNSCPSKSN